MSETRENAIIKVSAPIIEENGKEFVLSVSEEGDGYIGHGFSTTESVSDLGDGLFKIRRTIKN